MTQEPKDPEIRFACPKCGQHIAVPLDMAGAAMVCPSTPCSSSVQVPPLAGPIERSERGKVKPQSRGLRRLTAAVATAAVPALLVTAVIAILFALSRFSADHEVGVGDAAHSDPPLVRSGVDPSDYVPDPQMPWLSVGEVRAEREAEVLQAGAEGEEAYALALQYCYGLLGKERNVWEAEQLLSKLSSGGHAGATYHLGALIWRRHVGFVGHAPRRLFASPDVRRALHLLAVAQVLEGDGREGRAGHLLELCLEAFHDEGEEKAWVDFVASLAQPRSWRVGEGESFQAELVSFGDATAHLESVVGDGSNSCDVPLRDLCEDDMLHIATLREFGRTFAALAESRSGKGDYGAAWVLYRLAEQYGSSPDSHYGIGRLHHEGRGCRVDYGEALKHYGLAAEQGDAEASFYLGVMHDHGEGVTRDAVEAAKWYRLADEQGEAAAQFNLGLMYRRGEGVEQDSAEALKWYRLAAEQGEGGAQFGLGLMYRWGEGVEQDPAEAARWIRLAAAQGYAAAQNALGEMHDRGEGVERDLAEAAKWFRLAAAQGNSTAQNSLGLMYRLGEGVEQDPAEAAKWFRLAADQGVASAQFNLGVMYAQGEGVEHDPLEALKWCRLAAEQGEAAAQFSLALMYERGRDVRKDPAEALKWYRLAAEHGFAAAQLNLGVIYNRGDGVRKDATEALKWYRLAADGGDAKAQFNMGLMYHQGGAVTRDRNEARRWYRLAAGQGDLSALHNLGVLEARGNPTLAADYFVRAGRGYLASGERESAIKVVDRLKEVSADGLAAAFTRRGHSLVGVRSQESRYVLTRTVFACCALGHGATIADLDS